MLADDGLMLMAPISIDYILAASSLQKTLMILSIISASTYLMLKLMRVYSSRQRKEKRIEIVRKAKVVDAEVKDVREDDVLSFVPEKSDFECVIALPDFICKLDGCELNAIRKVFGFAYVSKEMRSTVEAYLDGLGIGFDELFIEKEFDDIVDYARKNSALVLGNVIEKSRENSVAFMSANGWAYLVRGLC
jgi:hypothetical protein